MIPNLIFIQSILNSVNMPLVFSSSEDLKKKLLNSSKKWREGLKKAKEAKDEGVRNMADSVEQAFDDCVSSVIFNSTEIRKVNNRADELQEGLDLANQKTDTILEDQATTQESFNLLEKRLEAVSAKEEKLERACRANTAATQRGDIERAANVIICRNVKQVSRPGVETYDDLEKAFYSAIKGLKLGTAIRVNYIRRLQRNSQDKSKAPALLRVELGSTGEKRKLFEAILDHTKRGGHFEPTIHNEIPQYAIGSHKYLSRVASVMRRHDRDIKTRVAILKGDTWPSISIRGRGSTGYSRLSDDDFKKAKELYLKSCIDEAAKKKAEQEERILLEDVDMHEPSNSSRGKKEVTIFHGQANVVEEG